MTHTSMPPGQFATGIDWIQHASAVPQDGSPAGSQILEIQAPTGDAHPDWVNRWSSAYRGHDKPVSLSDSLLIPVVLKSLHFSGPDLARLMQRTYQPLPRMRSRQTTKPTKPITIMKIDVNLPAGDGSSFEATIYQGETDPPSASRHPGRPRHSHAPDSDFPGRPLRNTGDIVATFGDADLIRHHDGRWELCGGSPADHAAAREWCAHFQHEPAMLTALVPVHAKPSPEPRAAHNRVLIADDDTLVRASLAAVLECEGFKVDEAQNGIEAVAQAIEHEPDLVLLDLNMPRWDGWTAFSQVDRVSPLVPVIVITARPNQYEKAVKMGVDAFMEKPLNIPMLISAIRRLIKEDHSRHVRRITSRSFVTQLLGSPAP